MITSNLKERILIIGGTGFVGKTLRKYWKESSVFYTSRVRNRDTNCVLLSDVNNEQSLKNIFKRNTFDIVINCATNADPVFNKMNGKEIFYQEISLTSSLIKLAQQYKFRLITMSSGVVNHSHSLDSGYLEGKRASEFLCNQVKEITDVKIVRLYSVTGEFLNLDSGLAICKFIKQAKNGQTLKVSNNKILRSYLYEDDLANSIRNFMFSDLYISDIGSLDMINIKELAETIANFYNVNVEFVDNEFIRNGSDEMIPSPQIKTNTISSKEAIIKTCKYF